jgi:hypothetical protein
MVTTIVFRRKNPSSLGSPATKTECGARLLDFFVVFDDCLTKKARNLGKNSSVPSCRGYRPKNGYYYRFLKENLSSLGSPAAKTECGAQLLDFFVVFDDCPSKKTRNFRKN